MTRISFLGYILSPDGLHTDPEKIWAVASFPVPTVADKTGAQNFFSAFNYQYLLMLVAIAMKLYQIEETLSLATYAKFNHCIAKNEGETCL